MNANASDSVLLNAWQRHRDAEAFHVIVNRHARLVYNTCRHIVRNDADAADVAQECFLSLATTPPDIERSLAGWLHRLATHRALNHLKQQTRRREREVRFARELPDAVHKESNELLTLIDAAIDALPDDVRLPLIGHFFGGKSHHDVAMELGIPRRTVSYRINSGIEQLRSVLTNRGLVAPAAGLAAFLERQRADAGVLPKELYASLSKYAIAGAAPYGARRFRLSGLAADGLRGSAYIAAILIIAASLLVSLSPGRSSKVPAALPETEVEAENEPSGGPLNMPVPAASQQANTREEATDERAAAGDAQAEVAGGIVSGRVYDADTDTPIAGAEVKIAKETDTYNPVATCATDADGRYESVALPPGAYMIYRGKTPGYGATSERINARGKTLPRSELDGIRFKLTGETTIDLPVRKGLVVSGIVVDGLGNGIPNATVSARTRFQNNGQTIRTSADGTFSLAGFSSTYDFCMAIQKTGFGRKNFSRLNLGYPGLKDLRIELPIAARVSGTVTQPDGSPLLDAKVVAVHVRNVKRWPLDFPESQTDSAGHYSIAGLGPGTYAIRISWGSNTIESRAKFVEVTPGSHIRDVDITMESRPGFHVAGTVTEPDGTPIPNQVITLSYLPTKTDAEGRFSMAGLKGGPHVFDAVVDGFRTRKGNKPINEPVEINSDRNDLHFVLYRNSFSLTGQVLVSGSGEPVEYFEIAVFPGHNYLPNSIENWQEAQRVYSKDGSFRLEELPLDPGPWTVVVRVPGFGLGTANLTIPRDSTEAEATIMVSEGRTVSGVVVDHNNMPVEGAEIIAGPPFESRVATSAADGSFRATGLPQNLKAPTPNGSGNHWTMTRLGGPGVGPADMETLTTFHPAYPPVSAPIPKGKGEAKVQFRFPPSGTVAVSITKNGKPVSMSEVSVTNGAMAGAPPSIGLSSKETNDEGTAVFSGLTVGPCDIFAQVLTGKGTTMELNRTVLVTAGNTTPLEIELGGALASLQGTFLFQGVVPESAEVTYGATTEAETMHFRGLTNPANGTWQFDDVPSGTGTLRFLPSGESQNSPERTITLDLEPGEVRTIDIDHGGPGDEAEEAGKIQGTLSVEGTAPKYARAVYTVTKGDTVLTYSQTVFRTNFEVSPDGVPINVDPELPADTAIEWSLEGVAAGDGVLTITVECQNEDEYEYSADLLLDPDETHKLEIALTADDKKVGLE